MFFISLPSQAHSGEGQGWVDVLVRVDHTIEAHTSNGDSASYISDSLTPITRDLYYLINNLESDLSQEFEAEADRNNGNTVVGSEVSINLSDGIFIKAYPRPIVQQEWVPCHPSEPWNCMQVP